MERTERGPFAVVAGALAVGATYVFFLIYAQFGFLHLLEDRLGEGSAVRPAMAAMGIAGLVASLATAAALRRVPAHLALIGGLFLCAVSGLGSIVAGSGPALIVSAALIGAATPNLSVSLCGSPPRLLPPSAPGPPPGSRPPAKGVALHGVGRNGFALAPRRGENSTRAWGGGGSPRPPAMRGMALRPRRRPSRARGRSTE